MDLISLLASCKSSGFLLFSSLARSCKTRRGYSGDKYRPFDKGKQRKESKRTIQRKRNRARYHTAYTAVVTVTSGVIYALLFYVSCCILASTQGICWETSDTSDTRLLFLPYIIFGLKCEMFSAFSTTARWCFNQE